MALVLSSAGAQRLTNPGAVTAGGEPCTFNNAQAFDDPQTPGDPAYRTLEDASVSVTAALGVLANDICFNDVDAFSISNQTLGTWQFHAYNGSFTFYPTPDAFGSAGVDYHLVTDEGEADAHATVTVLSVNDAPIIHEPPLGCTIVVEEDSGPYSTPLCGWWAEAGAANESAQTFTGQASSDNPGLFAAGPTLTLYAFQQPGPVSFTPKANAHGVATVQLWAKDSGGTANGGDDTSTKVQVTVTITPVSDPPVAVADSYSTPINTALVRSAGQGVLANDTEIDFVGLTATLVTGPAHGALNLSLSGAFTYTPQTGYSGSDSFTYKASNLTGTGSSNATVELTINAPGATPGPTAPPATAKPTGTPSTSGAPGSSASTAPQSAGSSPAPASPGASGPDASGPGASGPGASGPGASGPGATIDGPDDSAAAPGSQPPGASGPDPSQIGPVGAGSSSGDLLPLISIVLALVAFGGGLFWFQRQRRRASP